jgi:hypothetical protein
VATGLYRESAQVFATLESPRIATLDEALADSPADTLFCGELRPAWREQIAERFGHAGSRPRWPGPAAEPRRAGFLAELAWEMVQAGLTSDVATLQPLYLRRPAVTAPTPASAGTVR